MKPSRQQLSIGKTAGDSQFRSQQKIDETARQAADFVRNYHNPLYKISMTFLEPFPVFLVITLVSAAILRKKSSPMPA